MPRRRRTPPKSEQAQNFRAKIAAITSRSQRNELSNTRLTFPEFCFKCLPHKFSLAPSVHHETLFKLYPSLLTDPESRAAPVVIASARDSAKTTLTTAFLTWAGLEGLIKFALEIAASSQKAAEFLALIKSDILDSPRIQEYYPLAAQKGSIWNFTEMELANGFTIRAYGCGADGIRGSQSRFGRPDVVICDDIENDDGVRSVTQREKVAQWVDSNILNLGAGDRRAIVIMIGTTLRQDSVLLRKINNPYWRSFVFKAVLNWPDNFHLWQDWHEARTSFGPEASEAFYQKHEAEMLQGAEVAWPARYSVKSLMEKYFTAPISFEAEFQQKPVSEANLFYGALKFWDSEKSLPPGGVFMGAVDPALGNDAKKSDYSAVIIGYCVPSESRIYIVEAFLQRAPASTIIDRIIGFQTQYRCASWAIESHSWQSLFREKLIRTASDQKVPIPAYPIKPENNKDSRIRSLHPFIFNSNILLHCSQKLLLQQLENYPYDAHDDGPDALEMLWRQFSAKLGMSELVMTVRRERLPEAYAHYYV